MGVAPEEWMETRRVGVHRYGQNIIAVIENALRSIAVVHIDIKNCRSQAVGAQAFCRDGRIVEEAKSARKIAECMVAGRPREGIRGA